MKISILSDLHLEISNIQFKPIKCDVMILAGDISSGTLALDFIKYHISNGVKHILYIFGNHEFYDKINFDLNEEKLCKSKNLDSYDITIKNWLNIEKDIEELHILHKKEFILENVRFLGSTLWTDFNKTQKDMDISLNTMNDYNYITYKNRLITPHDIFNFHIIEKKWLIKELSDISKKDLITFVISHHLPSYQCILPQYHNNSANSSYASSLDNLMKKYKIDYWVHGHTHSSINLKIHNTEIICNPRGYCHKTKCENKDFNYEYLLEI
jgi:predicted phosphodiesterase